MSDERKSPWSSGEGLGHAGPVPSEPADGNWAPAPAQPAPSSSGQPSNYSNPVVGGSQPEQTTPFAAPPAASVEPTGWSEPQVFGWQAPAANPNTQLSPYSFGATVPYGFSSPPEHPNATVVLVLGILGFFTNFMFLPVVAPVAWVMGQRARTEMRQNPGKYRDSGKLTAGWVLGIISTLMAVLFCILFVVILAAALSS